MNIYIYGSKSFKNDVHDELDHSNIKFKLDESSSIIDIDKLEDLRHLVANNKEDIFLIDDAKIIKKDALNGKFKSKLKFLIPKDGIEEEFLFEHGVGDISFDSMDELAKHITNKLQEDTPSEDFENRDEIHESISNIVNDAYNEEDDSIALNDELSSLLVSNDFNEHPDEESNEPLHMEEYTSSHMKEPPTKLAHETNDVDEMLEDLMHMEVSNEDFANDDMMKELEDLSITNDDFDSSQESKKKNSIIEDSPDTNEQIGEIDMSNTDLNEELEGLDISNADFNGTISNTESAQAVKLDEIQGDFDMADFSSLDDINESDILAALNGEEVAINETQVLTSTKNEPVSVNINNTDDITELLSKLLKNKTLEITVKLKD